jgi:hypothetical protein
MVFISKFYWLVGKLKRLSWSKRMRRRRLERRNLVPDFPEVFLSSAERSLTKLGRSGTFSADFHAMVLVLVV